MALHPADDGSLVVNGAGEGPPEGTTTFLTFLSAFFAVVIVAAVGALVFALVSGPDSASGGTADDQGLRDEVMSQADQFILRANTYGPADLDENNAMPGYAERVREVITAKFEVSFDENLNLAEQTVSQAGYARTVDLYATGVESVDADNATVLVAGVLNGSYPDSSAEATDEERIEFEPQPFRFQVQLVKSDDEWLVDDFSPLSSEVVDPTEGLVDPAAPTGEPTAPSTSNGGEG